MKRRPIFGRCPGKRGSLQRFAPGSRAFSSGAGRAGFSLIELLVVVAIVLLLTTLYWGPNTANRQRALKRSCQKNLQKVYVALQIYANDNGGRFPVSAEAQTSEAALDSLVPRYTSDTSSFICPGSGDSSLPSGESFRNRQISYAYYMGVSLTNAPQPLMSDRQVDTQAKARGQLIFSRDGKPPGNNHRKYGGNVLFSDGQLQMTPARTPFSLSLGPGELLLNP